MNESSVSLPFREDFGPAAPVKTRNIVITSGKGGVGKTTATANLGMNRQRYNVTKKNMENLVASIGGLGYHYVLIDCPAGIDVGFVHAIAPAEEALIVTTPEITAIRDADRVAGLLEANGNL
eukprot:jgi/Botrbrau1/11406/Bobra.0151s0033.1